MHRPVALLMGVYLLADSSAAQERNILNNGGFESGLMCYSTSVWSLTNQDYKGDYRFLISNDSHSGANSIEIRCDGPDCLKAAIISDRIQTPPGQAYKLNLYTKCPAGRSAAAYIPGTAFGDTFQYLTCNNDWAFNEIYFAAGPSATDFFFYVYNRDVDWLRIDDMVLTYSDGTVPQQPVLHPGIRNVAVSGQTLLVDGAPYFGLGFFDVNYDDLPLALATGANTVTALGFNLSADCFNTDRRRYLDRAYELGLNFVPNSSSTARLGAPNILPAAISRFAPHLASILWFLADEPDQSNVPYWFIPPSSFLAEYQAAKPGIALPMMADFQRAAWSTISDTQPYAGSVDVWMAEPYGSDFSSVNHAINTFNTLSPQPIWLAQDAIDANLIVPKAYWAAISGATGIIYFSWDSFKTDSAKLDAASQAFSELNQLKNVIFAGDIGSQVTLPSGLGGIARSLNGSAYIIAANPTMEPVQGEVLVQGLEAGTQVGVLFENRTITAEAGGFTDTFSGISRHVYVIPGPPSPITIATAPAGLTVTADGISCVAPCTFQWVVGTSHTIAVNQTIEGAAAGTQYVFSGWSDGGAPSHSILTPASALALNAAFTTQFYLATAASPAAGGTVFPLSGWHDSGTIIPVSATVNNGFQFTGFSGSVAGAAVPENLLLNGPAAVTANFSAVMSRSGWYDAFTNRRRITIDHTKVSGTLSNFPVLVSVSDPELKSISLGGRIGTATGGDIAFTASDGVTKLDHELEQYDSSTGAVVAWVLVPSVNPSADTPIYIYYGKVAAIAQQSKTKVWDSSYRIVNHFKDASGVVTDSTQYGNSATSSGGVAFTAAGLAGPAYSFDGISGELTIPYASSWNGNFKNYTVQFWIKLGKPQDYVGAIAIGGWSSPFNIWFYANGNVDFRMDTAASFGCQVYGITPLDNAFHQLVLTYDAGPGQLYAYVDGVRTYSATCSGPIAIPAANLSVGGFAGERYLQSTIDELRISAVTRSSDWIATEYRNQKSPSTFYVVGPDTTP